MSDLIAARQRPIDSALKSMGLALVVMAVASSVSVAVSLTSVDLPRVAVAAAVVTIAIAAGFRAPSRTLFVLLIFLAILGSVRRIFLIFESAPVIDPLLLVSPVLLSLLTVVAIRSGALKDTTPLSKAVLVLSALSVAGALNPLQGGLLTGAAGLVFFFVPQLGFWVGRGLGDERTFGRVIKVIGACAPIVALYGLAQGFGIFPSWDRVWLSSVLTHYQALFVGSTIRPFASFSAASEYVGFITIGLVIWLTLVVRGLRTVLAFPVVAVLAAAVLFASARGALITVLLSATLMVGARWNLPLRVTLPAGAVLLLLVPSVFGVALAGIGSFASSDLIQHQVAGLADPLGASTLPIHISEMTQGFSFSLSHPLGIGIGAVSLAADRFGTGTQSTEVDPSNAGVALGLPGLAAYLVVLILGIRRAYELARTRGDGTSLLALGIPIALLLQWLNGGQYAVAFLPWLALGWADRARKGVRAD
jgi:hypothetical protein